MFSTKYTDRFEFNTDLICINHGLGFQLYDWSKFVRKSLNISEWKGASNDESLKTKTTPRERYMNPQTIEEYIALNDLYKLSR